MTTNTTKTLTGQNPIAPLTQRLNSMTVGQSTTVGAGSTSNPLGASNTTATAAAATTANKVQGNLGNVIDTLSNFLSTVFAYTAPTTRKTTTTAAQLTVQVPMNVGTGATNLRFLTDAATYYSASYAGGAVNMQQAGLNANTWVFKALYAGTFEGLQVVCYTGGPAATVVSLAKNGTTIYSTANLASPSRQVLALSGLTFAAGDEMTMTVIGSATGFLSVAAKLQVRM